MMGTTDGQSPLFYVGVDVEDRVPPDHPLRLVKQRVIRLGAFTTDQMNEMLLGVLEQQRELIEQGAIVVVEPERVRTHRLPIW